MVSCMVMAGRDWQRGMCGVEVAMWEGGEVSRSGVQVEHVCAGDVSSCVASIGVGDWWDCGDCEWIWACGWSWTAWKCWISGLLYRLKREVISGG